VAYSYRMTVARPSQYPESSKPRVAGQSRSSTLRVVAVIDAAAVSGPGRQLVALAQALPSLGVEVSVITFARDGGAEHGFREYLRDHRIHHEVIRERGLFYPGAVWDLAGRLSQLQPDIVQTHGYKPSVYAWLLRRIPRRWGWIAFFHGATNENAKVRFYNRLHDAVLGGADEVVVMASRHLARIGNAHVRVIYNAVLDLPAAEDATFRVTLRDLALPHPRLLVLGRLSREKGVDVMLRAARISTDRGIPVTVLVVGDGPERERLQGLAAELALSDRVAFLTSTRDVGAVYSACDALVIPSRSEGLPNVLLEALAHDLPVLSSDVGAVREVLGSTGTGVIVPPESPEDLAAAIPRVLAMRADPAASAARRAVIGTFSLVGRARAHLELYRDVLERRSQQK
jgi:glycosyltransferase involved in cell wall biosynthesis